ncbi:MAG: lipoprotein [Gammaproteobacteria bacterium]|nr:lipoprotein [Gammaproteobacteria bacterium]
MQLHDGVVSSQSAADLEELYVLLGQARDAWCALSIDRHALHGSALQVICRHLGPGRVTVFCESDDAALEITVIDEQGSFFHARHDDAHEGPALCALDQFLAAVRYRQNGAALPPSAGPGGGAGPRFYRLSRTVQHLTLPADKRAVPFLDLQAIGEKGRRRAVLHGVLQWDRVFATRARRGLSRATGSVCAGLAQRRRTLPDPPHRYRSECARRQHPAEPANGPLPAAQTAARAAHRAGAARRADLNPAGRRKRAIIRAHSAGVTLVRLFLFACILVMLSGCGQKGPLFLPPDPPPAPAGTP